MGWTAKNVYILDRRVRMALMKMKLARYGDFCFFGQLWIDFHVWDERGRRFVDLLGWFKLLEDKGLRPFRGEALSPETFTHCLHAMFCVSFFIAEF